MCPRSRPPHREKNYIKFLVRDFVNPLDVAWSILKENVEKTDYYNAQWHWENPTGLRDDFEDMGLGIKEAQEWLDGEWAQKIKEQQGISDEPVSIPDNLMSSLDAAHSKLGPANRYAGMWQQDNS